jgi:hypothetical protein
MDTEVHINIAVRIVLFSDMTHNANIPTVQPPTALKQTNKKLSALSAKLSTYQPLT